MRVLFVGGDPETAEKVSLSVRLRWPEATVLVTHGLEDGLLVVEQQTPDVVLVQDGSEGMGVLEFISELRKFSDVILLALERVGGGGNLDEVKTLEMGADDYIRQSAGILDMVARLVAIVRRVNRTKLSGIQQSLAMGDLTLDPANYEVFLHGSRLSLTSTEFRVLHLLLNNRGRVVTHEFLSQSIWGDQVDSSALAKKYIQRLRRKLGDDARDPTWISNVHGVGYRLVNGREPLVEAAAV